MTEDSLRHCGLERAAEMLEMQCDEDDHEGCTFVSCMPEAQRSAHDVFLPALNKPKQSYESWLFRLPSFTMECIAIDVLHVCYLGVSQDILENLFWECCGSIFKDKKREDQVRSLWARIKAWYRVSRCEACLLSAGFLHGDVCRARPNGDGSQGDPDVRLDVHFPEQLCRRKQQVLACQAKATHLPRARRVSDVDCWQPPRFWCDADESFVGFISEIGRTHGGGPRIFRQCSKIARLFGSSMQQAWCTTVAYQVTHHQYHRLSRLWKSCHVWV